MRSLSIVTVAAAIGLALSCGSPDVSAAKKVIYVAEYTIIEAQNGEAWAADDKTLDKKLADIRKKNGGKAPNIIYILLDDVGFGEIGMDNLSVIRGYKTPNMTADPAHMVTGVELRDGKLYEVEMEAGEAWTQKKYREMNERYQRNALGQLRCVPT